ncbi:TolC family protein [Marinoscillum furvescens]|uniref:Outer membrane protein TolC n=1 Tax=Marinoscillum furvescens DSM 4134 TaxID=1122208 RepID=A0A3D9L1M7_MARFU|nr:TolC family protein [Marinoscillum furvescens]RED96133.1 outer membrane protein TolC [Marinoscillum furvescens DSM 4134]
MNRYLLLLAAMILATGSLFAQLTLIDVIEQAKAQSPMAKAAETRKKNSYWEYRRFRADYNPTLQLYGNLPGYNRDFFENRLDDGQIDFQSRQQISSALSLGLFQPIALTGGNISVNSRVNQFNDLSQDLTRYNTTLFNIELEQPVFGFNNLKWDKRTEPLRYEESKRSFVEEMESISKEATRRYFDYLDAQINLQIAEFNLANNDTIYRIEEGRYNIGKTTRDKLLQVELQLLQSRQDVTQAQLDMQTSRLSLRRYIGLQDSSNVKLELVMPAELPKFAIPLSDALTYAKQNRSDYLAYERRKIEANRDVARAKSQRFRTEIQASFGLNDAEPVLSETYSQPNQQQRLNVTLSMPVLDWGRSKARVQTALANQELASYSLAQDIQNFEQEIMTLVSRFEVLRLQVEITKKSDEVAQERYLVTQNRYLIGKIDITNLNIALKEKDSAKRNYIRALREFWIAYFDLRRLTLYDFLNDELLYQQEG